MYELVLNWGVSRFGVRSIWAPLLAKDARNGAPGWDVPSAFLWIQEARLARPDSRGAAVPTWFMPTAWLRATRNTPLGLLRVLLAPRSVHSGRCLAGLRRS